MRRFWTPESLDQLRALYPHRPTREVAAKSDFFESKPVEAKPALRIEASRKAAQ